MDGCFSTNAARRSMIPRSSFILALYWWVARDRLTARHAWRSLRLCSFIKKSTASLCSSGPTTFFLSGLSMHNLLCLPQLTYTSIWHSPSQAPWASWFPGLPFPRILPSSCKRSTGWYKTHDRCRVSQSLLPVSSGWKQSLSYVTCPLLLSFLTATGKIWNLEI